MFADLSCLEYEIFDHQVIKQTEPVTTLLSSSIFRIRLSRSCCTDSFSIHFVGSNSSASPGPICPVVLLLLRLLETFPKSTQLLCKPSWASLHWASVDLVDGSCLASGRIQASSHTR